MIKQLQSGMIFYDDPNPEGLQPVLLLHGLGSDSSSWQLQMGALIGNNLRPITIDIPGFGRSTCETQSWNFEYCAAICIEIINTLAIGKFDLIGISMGGVVAQFIGLNYPERINKLVLINTFASIRPQKLDQWYYLIKRYLSTRLLGKNEQAKLVAYRLFPDPDQQIYRDEIIRQITRADAHVYQQALTRLGLLDNRKRMKKIQNETLVLTAEGDTTVPVQNQIEMAKLIPGAKQVFIPKSRHAVIIDQPEIVNQKIVAFLIEK